MRDKSIVFLMLIGVVLFLGLPQEAWNEESVAISSDCEQALQEAYEQDESLVFYRDAWLKKKDDFYWSILVEITPFFLQREIQETEDPCVKLVRSWQLYCYTVSLRKGLLPNWRQVGLGEDKTAILKTVEKEIPELLDIVGRVWISDREEAVRLQQYEGFGWIKERSKELFRDLAEENSWDESTRAWWQIQQAYFLIMEDDQQALEEARVLVEKVRERYSDWSEPTIALAFVDYRLGNYTQAKEWYDLLASKDSSAPLLYASVEMEEVNTGLREKGYFDTPTPTPQPTEPPHYETRPEVAIGVAVGVGALLYWVGKALFGGDSSSSSSSSSSSYSNSEKVWNCEVECRRGGIGYGWSEYSRIVTVKAMYESEAKRKAEERFDEENSCSGSSSSGWSDYWPSVKKCECLN